MGSLGAPEILVILVVALLVLGPDKLPDAARQAGRAIAELRKMSSGFQAEIRDAMKTPEAGPVPPTAQAAGESSTPLPPQRYLWSDLPGSETSAAEGNATDAGQ